MKSNSGPAYHHYLNWKNLLHCGNFQGCKLVFQLTILWEVLTETTIWRDNLRIDVRGFSSIVPLTFSTMSSDTLGRSEYLLLCIVPVLAKWFTMSPVCFCKEESLPRNLGNLARNSLLQEKTVHMFHLQRVIAITRHHNRSISFYSETRCPKFINLKLV